MDADKIAKLLGEPPPALKAQVDEAIRHTLQVLAIKLPSDIAEMLPPLPVVVFDLKGTTAGQAWTGENKIRVNLGVLMNPKYQEDMLEQTIPHEVAHLVTRAIWGSQVKSHGRQWAFIMNLLGKPAKRCHTYEVEPARKRAKPFRYECDCQTHMVSVTIHRRITQGREYKCTDCNGRLR